MQRNRLLDETVSLQFSGDITSVSWTLNYSQIVSVTLMSVQLLNTSVYLWKQSIQDILMSFNHQQQECSSLRKHKCAPKGEKQHSADNVCYATGKIIQRRLVSLVTLSYSMSFQRSQYLDYTQFLVYSHDSLHQNQSDSHHTSFTCSSDFV